MTSSIPYGALAALGVVVFGFRMIAGRLAPFSRRRAATAVRSSRGENFAVILAVLECARLALTMVQSSVAARLPVLTANAIVAVAVIIVIALAVMPARTTALIGLVGLIAGLAEAYVRDGVAIGATLTVMSMLLLWLLAVVRGFTCA
jgi:hypothetical protein